MFCETLCIFWTFAYMRKFFFYFMNFISLNTDGYDFSASPIDDITAQYHIFVVSISNFFFEKALDNRYRVEMHVHSPIFHGQFREKIDR